MISPAPMAEIFYEEKPMKPHEIIKEIEHLCLSDKLLLVADVWDSIARTNDVPPMPEWQKTELDRRYSDYKNKKSGLYDYKEVHGELRARTT
uniref:Putative addiction module component, TIGR02574 family n=1 Tax=Candidatus Kentrum sp. DK TaxID=2126562 RepID=A0A450RTR2_9GAMM|nr:MAG: putative addiction module component, TIGR02574 family [Candidatus Kentron sp. DK]